MTSFLAQNDEVCYELCMGKDGVPGRCRKCHGFGYEHRATGSLISVIPCPLLARGRMGIVMLLLDQVESCKS